MTHVRANYLDFSSLFSVDQEDVIHCFAKACETLDISSFKKYKLSEKEKDELVVQAKEKCFKFLLLVEISLA